MQHTAPSPRGFSHRKTLVLAAALLLLHVVGDIFLPLKADLRSFDPHDMARLETAMWQSYYDRKPVTLFFELAEMLRTQFGFPLVRCQRHGFAILPRCFLRRARRLCVQRS